jgi:hypothetical protein
MELLVYAYDMTVTAARAVGADTLLSPGETTDFQLTIRNDGSKNAIGVSAVATSLDTNITVNDSVASFGNVNVGASATSTANPFNMTANETALRGYQAKLKITFSSLAGATQTDTITIALGIKTSVDPQGPDAYGYYCLDNTDIGFTQRPIYNWIEIDDRYGGHGTNLNINDPSENADATVLVTLPFDFTFYGVTTGQIAVCSNGWISTTPDVSYTDFRNYPIPSAPGPTGMIAPFWDDLTTSSNGRVYAYNDSLFHRYIIEWSRMPNYGQSSTLETFEAVLYDPAYYPTHTGDGEILFQYNNITEVNGQGDDNPYSTIGIEKPGYQDGTEIAYWNTYNDPATAHVQSGRAYFFSTDLVLGEGPPMIFVDPTNVILNVPHDGVGSTRMNVTNEGSSLLTFTTTLTLQQDGNRVTIPGMPSPEDAQGGPDAFGYTWKDSDEPNGPVYNWKDISLIGTPVTFFDQDSSTQAMPTGFAFPLYGQTYTNYYLSPNGYISFSSQVPGITNLTLPNVQQPYNLIAGFWDDLDPLQTGAHVYSWNNGVDSLVVSFVDVPHWGSSVVGTYSFQMILLADGTITCQYQTLVGNYQSSTVGIQNGNGTVGLQVCYNQPYLQNGLAIRFYDPLLRLQPGAGSIIPGHTTPINIVGYAYGMQSGNYSATIGIDSDDPINPHLNVPVLLHIGNQPGLQIEVTMNPVNPPIVIPQNGGSFSFNGVLGNHAAGAQMVDFWTMITLPNGSPFGPTILREDINLYSGVSINRTINQNIPGNAPAGEYFFYATAGAYPDTVFASDGFSFYKSSTVTYGSGADDWGVTGWEDAISPVPLQFAFKGCKPNPFNPTTEVLFDLPQVMHVEIQIFDIMGRQVATLQNGLMDPGSHIVRWDASKNSSGVYFLRFESGNFKTTSKLLLVK